MALALAGCAGAEDSAPDRPPPAGGGERASAEPPAPPRPLEDGWYRDSNANSIPDLAEQETGRNPRADECLPDRCRPPEGTSSIELAEGRNTLILLDSSGSMAGPAGGGRIKLDAAKQAIRTYIDSTPRSVDRLGLAVYGHRGSSEESGKAESCRETETFAPIGELTSASAPRILRRFEPTGWTPVAGALESSESALRGREGEINRVILVSDGVETCGGDPVGVARSLNESGIDVTVDVVGFDIREEVDVQRLRRVADAGGGEYVDAKTAGDLSDYFDRLSERRRDLLQSIPCISTSLSSSTICKSRLYTDATFYMSRQRSEAQFDGNRPRADAINAMIDKVSAVRDREVSAPFDERQRRIDAIQRELDEIDRRLER